jgi:hypothetical protein
MKEWKCPNCKRDKITEENIVLSMCVCGEYFKEREEKNERDT